PRIGETRRCELVAARVDRCSGMFDARYASVYDCACHACMDQPGEIRMTEPDANRRPIAARDTGWARNIAAALARSSISPNQISVASVLFALAGAAALVWWPGYGGLLT